MKPAAWTKMHPSMPVSLSRSPSRIPRQASGRALRDWNDSASWGTAWMRHLLSGVVPSGYSTYSGSSPVGIASSPSRMWRCSYKCRDRQESQRRFILADGLRPGELLFRETRVDINPSEEGHHQLLVTEFLCLVSS